MRLTCKETVFLPVDPNLSCFLFIYELILLSLNTLSFNTTDSEISLIFDYFFLKGLSDVTSSVLSCPITELSKL